MTEGNDSLKRILSSFIQYGSQYCGSLSEWEQMSEVTQTPFLH